MIIKEYKLVSAEEDGTFPKLQVIHEYDYDPECDFYVYYTGNKNYELEYFFFGEQLELQNNYVEHFYILSYNETGNIIGIMKLSSGSRKGTTLPYDALFTYLLLTKNIWLLLFERAISGFPTTPVTLISSYV